jgi:G protein-coupled receptor Mth (Methuselah protein)
LHRFRKGIRSDKTKKFLKYCIYAFGVPLLLVSIVFILNEFQLVHSEYSSRIGNGSCTVTDPDLITEEGSALRKRQLIYIYAPICLFIVVNTIFYAVTAWKIYRVQKETSIVKRGDSNRHAKKEKARWVGVINCLRH